MSISYTRLIPVVVMACAGWSVADVRTAGQSQSQTPAAPNAPPRPYFTEPSISPDRTEIAFASGGDIWTAPVGGGDARLLVSHVATESHPIFSPDGRTLALVSDRTGGGDIYLLTLATGDLRRLTFDDGNEILDGWSRDGQWIHYSSGTRDIAGNDLYRVRAAGGTPMLVSADRFTNEFFSAPSPDGQTLAFSARGNASGQWWRKGHSHLDESEIWIMKGFQTSGYEKIVDRGAKNLWPMWSADGRSLFYMSDRSGAENIWVKPLSGQPRAVTQFKAGRVLWPNISYDGSTIVFERNFGIWKLDTQSGQAAEVRIARRGASIGPVTEHLSLTTGFQDLALSPDGRKVAFVARGEIFAASARDGGDAARVTRSLARESQVAWAPDSRRLAYVSERDEVQHLFLYDFGTSTETQLTRDVKGDDAPKFSPDGQQLAFVRDDKELRVMDLASRQESVLAKGFISASPRSLAWSADSKWLAYLGLSTRSFRNAYIVPAAGGDSRAVSAIPNANTGTLSWSPDGAFLVFNTSQRTEDTEVVRVELTLKPPKFAEDQFRDLFKDEPARDRPAPGRAGGAAAPAGAAPGGGGAGRSNEVKPVEIVFEDIRRRVSVLPVGENYSAETISPDGKWLLVNGAGNLHVYPLDAPTGGGGRGGGGPAGGSQTRQLTTSTAAKSFAQFTPDSREVFFLEQGRINIVAVEARQPRAVSVTAELDVDFSREKMEVFRQAWTYMRDGFYDDKFHGADWGEVRAEFTPVVAGVRTTDELRRVLNLMFGELNASHLGASGPGGGGQASNNGRLGLYFDRAEYETNGRLRVTEVISLSPAAISKQLKTGDYLLSVDGVAIDAKTNLDEQLMHKVGRRVELKVASSADGANARDVVVQPISQAAERALLYRDWVEANRAYVEKVSGGKLGYVHIRDMSAGALRQLYLDLDADNRAKSGVVIDVRHNNGGFVNVYAIDVLARRGYLTMTPRGLPASPARTSLGQRSLELPTILVTNQHSLSDAEDFTEGYRSLKLGKVVGEPTSGWIIFTGSQTLVDGTAIRMPGTRITSNDGKTMELNPRPVDVPVTRPIGETTTGKDSQLETAVRELLKQIGG
ncbi:MAG TPA: S41 family peptidase [Vicinamibacterales bacterium]|nr:S41 family peptidase [Vicinamibacterales bacterium]